MTKLSTGPNEPLHNETPQRLQFDKPRGWYRYGRIPYNIFYSFDIKTTKIFNKHLLNEKNPARHSITENTGGGASLSIWIHESVPSNFVDIVMFHELTEAEFIYADGLSPTDAHERSAIETLKYAKIHLSNDELENFNEWNRTLN